MTSCTNSLTHPISFTKNRGDVFSCTDHFFISGYLATDTTCVKCALLDDYDISEVNLSDHCPVLLQVNSATGPDVREPVNRPLHHSSVAWNKAFTNNIANYQTELSRTVNTMSSNIPAEIRECRDSKSRDHLTCIDRCASKLHHALFDATEKYILRIRQQAIAACPRLL